MYMRKRLGMICIALGLMVGLTACEKTKTINGEESTEITTEDLSQEHTTSETTNLESTEAKPTNTDTDKQVEEVNQGANEDSTQAAEETLNPEVSKETKDSTQENTQKSTQAQDKSTALGEKLPATNTDYDSISNQKYEWWFKRNTEHEKSGAQEIVDIAKYDAFYVDSKTKDKVIYLTFDCGYENGYTNTILDILKKHNAKAIFFVTKPFVKDNIEIAKRMKEEGHFVGNHTCKHPSMPSKTVEQLKKEINGCAEYFKEATGYDIDPFFRPPMGEYSERTLQLTKDLGYKTIFWSMAYLDYDVNNQPGAEYVVNHFKKYYHSGAIPLIHNVSKSNTQALDEVLTFLEKEGYRFGTVDEIK